MAVVLTARDLTRHYEVSRGLFKGHATVRALNGVSLTVRAGAAGQRPSHAWRVAAFLKISRLASLGGGSLRRAASRTPSPS